MSKCIKCGDIINSEFEICYDCKNLSDEQIKNKFDNKRINSDKAKLSKEFYYKLYNLFVIPGLIIAITGGIGNAELIGGDDFYRVFQGVVGYGLGTLFIGYYPVKLIMLFVNRYKNNKWEWPIGYSYFILPILISFITFFF